MNDIIKNERTNSILDAMNRRNTNSMRKAGNVFEALDDEELTEKEKSEGLNETESS